MQNAANPLNVDILIPGNVAWNEDLSWETKLFYGVIRGHCRNDFYCCYASNEYLAKLLSCDERSVRRMVSKLVEVGALFRAKGYVTSEAGELFFSQRLLVPTELKRQFEKSQDRALDIKANAKKNARRVDKIVRPRADTAVHLNKNNIPYENNITSTNNEVRNNPLTPLQGGKAAVELKNPQQLTFGKEQNVYLTDSQRRLLGEEFGEMTAQSLIEQLSAYIKSNVKRFRKKVEHYSILRDWGLRRKERATPTTTQKVIIGKGIARAEYSAEEIEAIYTKLDEEET